MAELIFITATLLAVGIVIIMALALAYFVFRWLALDRPARQRQQTQLARTREQLRDFYGPLHVLAQATRDVGDVAWGTEQWDSVWRETVLPAYAQIESILVNRIDLLDDDEVPPSFLSFLTHSMINRSYRDTGLRPGYFQMDVSYPTAFTQDIAEGYARKRAEYVRLLRGNDL